MSVVERAGGGDTTSILAKHRLENRMKELVCSQKWSLESKPIAQFVQLYGNVLHPLTVLFSVLLLFEHCVEPTNRTFDFMLKHALAFYFYIFMFIEL